MKENFTQHVVVCNNLPASIEKVIEERHLNEHTLLTRIGMDSGGGFLKICLSVFDLLNPVDVQRKTFAKKFKNSGEKKSSY